MTSGQGGIASAPDSPPASPLYTHVNVLGILLNHGLVEGLAAKELAALRCTCREARELSYSAIQQATLQLPSPNRTAAYLPDPSAVGRFLAKLSAPAWTLVVKCAAQPAVTPGAIHTSRQDVYEHDAELYAEAVVGAAGAGGIRAARMRVVIVHAGVHNTMPSARPFPAAAVTALLSAPHLRLQSFDISCQRLQAVRGAYRISAYCARQLLGALAQHHAATLRALGAWCLPPLQELATSLHSFPQLRVLHTNWDLSAAVNVLVWVTQGSLRTRLEELSVGGLPNGHQPEPMWGSGSLSLPRVHTLTCVPPEAQRMPTAHSAAGHGAMRLQGSTRVAMLSAFPALRHLHGVWAAVHPNQGIPLAEWQDLMALMPQLQQLRGDWGPHIGFERSALPGHPSGLLPGALHGASCALIIFRGCDAAGLGVCMAGDEEHAPPHPAVPLLAALLDSLSGIQRLSLRINMAVDALAFLQRLLPALAHLPATLQAVAFRKGPSVGAAAEEEAFLQRLAVAAPPSLQRIQLRGFSAHACRDIRTADGRLVHVADEDGD